MAVKRIVEEKDYVPDNYIAEQFILRSFRKADKPTGFPENFRHLAVYGQQRGRMGKSTYFYSEESLELLDIKIISTETAVIPHRKVPGHVCASFKPYYGLNITTGMPQKMDKFFFGDDVKTLKAMLSYV